MMCRFRPGSWKAYLPALLWSSLLLPQSSAVRISELLTTEVDVHAAVDVETVKVGLAKVSKGLAETIAPWNKAVTTQGRDFRPTFGNRFWEVVAHALRTEPQDTLNDLKGTWDTAFQDVGGLDSFIQDWGSKGDLDKLQFALTQLISKAEVVVAAYAQAKPYLEASSDLVDGLKGAVIQIQDGALAEGVNSLWTSHVAAAGRLVTGLSRANLEAISQIILDAGSVDGETHGMVYTTSKYRQDRFLVAVCYQRTPLKENERAPICMENWNNDGEGMCFPDKLSGAPCRSACGGNSGICPNYCGETKACCRQGHKEDSPECRGGSGYIDHPANRETPRDYWQCIDPGPGLGPEEDCWSWCNGRAGPCNACSLNGFCMKDGKYINAGNRSRAPRWFGGELFQRHPEAFVIEGAGHKAVNGVWIQSGWRKGHPYYRRNGFWNKKRYQMYWSVSRKAWRLMNDGYFGNQDLYLSTEQTPTVPTTGWVAKDGAGPAPTLTFVNDGIYEQTGNSKNKPAQGGNYRCVRIIPEDPPEEEEAPTEAAPEDEEEEEEAAAADPAAELELARPAIIEEGGASLAQRRASAAGAGKAPWWCFWCKKEILLGGVPAKCNLTTPYKSPSNGYCYKYNCELGFDPVKDSEIDCQQRCWGERNVPVGPVCGRSPEEATQIAATLARTAGASAIGLVTVIPKLADRGLNTDMAVFESGLGSLSNLITEVFANRDCPIDPNPEV